MKNKLKELREAAGLTQQDLAVGAKMQASQVSRLERNVTSLMNMTVRTAVAMADVLNIPVAEFIAAMQEWEEQEKAARGE